MPPEAAEDPAPPQVLAPSHSHHPRDQVVATVLAFEAVRGQGVSQRQFAREAEIPRATLQGWLAAKTRLDDDPAVVAFFESPAGLRVLHRLLLAALFVMTLVGACGVRQVRMLLDLAGLSPWLACSYTTLRRRAAALEDDVVQFADAERRRLATTMPPRAITTCQDETFHPQPCLVAIEPVSDFILLERYAAGRDERTWTTAMATAVAGLPITIAQVTSDEARGLRKHVRDALGAHPSPDVFHVQHEVQRGTGAPLAAQTRRAQEALVAARTTPEGHTTTAPRAPHHHRLITASWPGLGSRPTGAILRRVAALCRGSTIVVSLLGATVACVHIPTRSRQTAHAPTSTSSPARSMNPSIFAPAAVAEVASIGTTSAIAWMPDDAHPFPASFAEAQTWASEVPPGFVPVQPDLGRAARETLLRPGVWYVRGATGCTEVRIEPATYPIRGGVAGELIAPFVSGSGPRRRVRYEYLLDDTGERRSEVTSGATREHWTLVATTEPIPRPAPRARTLVVPTSLTVVLQGPTLDEWHEHDERWEPRILARCAVPRELIVADPDRLGFLRDTISMVRAYRPERVEFWYAHAAACAAAAPTRAGRLADCGSLVPPPEMQPSLRDAMIPAVALRGGAGPLAP